MKPHISPCFSVALTVPIALRNHFFHGWMDAWMDGWMDGWVDGWIDGWMDGMDVWMHGLQDDIATFQFKEAILQNHQCF